ncbi:hypothetical protein FSP39_010874 [Pinctada imbricata]|uniref:Uncharacterized protein n=1 Tax=Pinctada imbricata TaxID=66713 RepID=A0AA88Y668_PINIB|nr:hypothetical protein FSP39_010874 [Pinctada imbricata]
MTDQLVPGSYSEVVPTLPKTCVTNNENQPPKLIQGPVFMSPSQFKMKLLKRMASVDGTGGGTIDRRSLKTLQRNNSDRTMKASIVFPNGEVGTLISLERIEKPKEDDESRKFPSLKETDFFDQNALMHPAPRKERPLRLPPIQLPRIYTLKPLPILPTEYDSVTPSPRPLTDEEWEDLKECRYLRPSPPKYRSKDLY